MRIIKKAVKRFFRKYGYELIKVSNDAKGIDPYLDMKRLLSDVQQPLILDIGANVGQSVEKMLEAFPNATTHSFEPSPATFQTLSKACNAYPNSQAWNLGMGSTIQQLQFFENEHLDMSSFLSPSEQSWGVISKTTNVPITTVDKFTEERGIDYVHILKTDTQGYDFEVLKGAQEMFTKNKIALVYFEFIFSDMYKGLPKFHEVFEYLDKHNFDLVTFYQSHFQGDLVGWTDALMVNRNYYKQKTQA